MKNIYDILEQLEISYQKIEHPPVMTVDDAEQYWSKIEARHCKNLFLRNKKGNRHYLVVAEHRKQVSIKDIEKLVNADRLSFASDERLEKYLGLKAGSVSPFGLINDSNKDVVVLLDKDMENSEKITFHPNTNTATLVVTYSDFLKFLDFCGNERLFF